MNDTRIFTVDKFLGLNESADGTTELKLGEATKVENFYITDGYNLKTRPGIARYLFGEGVYLDRAFPFTIKGEPWLITIEDYESCSDVAFYRDGKLALAMTEPGLFVRQVFLYDGKACFLTATGNVVTEEFDDVGIQYVDFPEGSSDPARVISQLYRPLILSGCSPSGGGKTIEPMNILTPDCRIQFASDGESASYVFPTNISAVTGVSYGNESHLADGSFNAQTHTFTFSDGKIPGEGLDVEFSCTVTDSDLDAAKNRFLKMLHHEYYNGATDSRIFFYGDGSNLCYYTGVPAHGTGFYVPAGNELCVDFSDSPITGMVRHYSRLLVFKPDGVEAITYEPVTLADGSVIAGFYLRPVSREYGNEAMGQVALVNNHPRTFSGGSIYDWKITSTQYRDERYAKCISQKVAKTLSAADLSKAVVCDDDASKTYYVFLNDDQGTVLVHRYDLDVWSIYKSPLATRVHQGFVFDGSVVFHSTTGLFTFDSESAYDCPEAWNGERTPIQCTWESGYMAFGADYRRKYSSNLWVSLLPDGRSWLEVTVKTDKRSEYLTKVISNTLACFDHLDFANFSFQTYAAPKIRRIKLKVKKFVYYKLILRVTKPGASATVLGYDQQVRYSSNVK